MVKQKTLKVRLEEIRMNASAIFHLRGISFLSFIVGDGRKWGRNGRVKVGA